MSLLIGATSGLQGAAGSQAAAADLGEPINQSVRFTGDGRLVASTSGPSGNFTLSFWWKRAIGVTNTHTFLMFTPNQAYQFTQGTEDRIASRVTSFDYLTDSKQRDHSAWYHLVFVNDSGTTTLYINGVQQSNTATTPSGGGNMCIGSNSTSVQDDRLVGYLAEYNLLDGQTLSPTDFGRYNDDDVWVPIELSFTSAQYGAKGFRLVFDSSADGGIGDDSAPTGTGHTAANDFTPTGFDTAAISSGNPDNDVDFLDTPTSNYATFNGVLHPNNQTLSNANLTGGTTSTLTSLTTQLPNYKYYWEATGSDYYYGISEIDAVRDSYLGSKANQVGWFNDGSFWVNASNVGTFGPSFSTTDIAMQAYDPATGNYWVGINGTWHGSGDPENGTNPAYTVGASIRENMVPANNVSSGTASYNFGQMSFIYTKPTGFEALQTNNLSEPTIKNGKDHFDAVTYSGNTSTNAITSLEFQPDFVWIKCRNIGSSHGLYDSVRGVNIELRSDTNDDEFTFTDSLNSFDSNGFTLGTDTGNGNVNLSGRTYVAWCWKAGGTAVSNTDGTITSSVSANTDAGFSIVSYTGTGANATVGHGLTEAPDLVIYKDRDANSAWVVYNSTLLSATEYLQLNLSNTKVTGATTVFNSLRPTNTVLNLGSSSLTNSTNNMIAYCWHSVPGFSKINYYQGNGSTDGPFIYTGFKVSFLMIKSVTTADWFIHDAARFPNNPSTQILRPNAAAGESGTGNDVDFLSNGFKIRNTVSNVNSSGVNYLYMVFAESPFGGENAPPATAR